MINRLTDKLFGLLNNRLTLWLNNGMLDWDIDLSVALNTFSQVTNTEKLMV